MKKDKGAICAAIVVGLIFFIAPFWENWPSLLIMIIGFFLYWFCSMFFLGAAYQMLTGWTPKDNKDK